MFERYSEKARRTIFFARHEAGAFGSPEIEPHHIMLGLLHEAWHLFAPFLESQQTASAIRDELTERFPRTVETPAHGDMPLTQAAQRVLVHAAEEAERLRSLTIGPEHLLVALLREQKGVAAEILARYGMRLDDLRSAYAQAAPVGTAIEQSIARLRALPEDRLGTAHRILAALAEDPVRVTVATAAELFTISFGWNGEAPDAGP